LANTKSSSYQSNTNCPYQAFLESTSSYDTVDSSFGNYWNNAEKQQTELKRS